MTSGELRGDTGAPAGPWRASRDPRKEEAISGPRCWWVADGLRTLPDLTESEALAVRDALNALGRAPRPPDDVLTAARALIAEGPFHTIPPTLGALERLADAVAKSGAPRPEPLRPSDPSDEWVRFISEPSDEQLTDAYVAGCNAESELTDAELSPQNVRKGVAAAMRAALRGAPALPPQPTRDTEHQHLRDMMRRIAEALGHSSAGVLELTCKDGESPAERLAREVEELVRARSSLPSGPPKSRSELKRRLAQGDPSVNDNTVPLADQGGPPEGVKP